MALRMYLECNRSVVPAQILFAAQGHPIGGAENSFYISGLTGSNLDNQVSPAIRVLGAVCDLAIDAQAVQATVQGQMRVKVTDLGIQGRNLARLNVRWIGDDQIKSL